MKPCFGYIRVSTQKQGEGVSLEAQKEAITAFASRNSLRIVEWFEEKETAAKSGRPVFTRMLKLLERGKASGLIIHKIDRSARNLRDWAIIGDLSDKGIDVHFATESLDFRSRGGRLTADIQAVIAADYIRNLREETKKGIDGRLKQGLFPFKAPLGYLNTGGGKVKTLDPCKAPLVRELFHLYAQGQYSMRLLLAEMNRRGLRNHNDRPLTLHGLETILRNSFYCGQITIRRSGQTFPGIHEPLITVRTFTRVQDIKSGRYHQLATRHNHTYRGLFRCGLCDGPMIPELQKGRVYYRCHTRACITKTIREDVLEDAIAEALRRLQLDEETERQMLARWEEQAFEDENEAARSAIRLRIADEECRQDRLTDLLIDGTIDKATFHQRQQSLKLRLAELEEQLAEASNFDQVEQDRIKFLELMKSLVLLHENADPVEKRMIVENCFSNRTVVGKNPVLEAYNWLLMGENGDGVPNGGHDRDRNRTIAAFLMKFIKPSVE
jgi:site-specific DNA recombinase